MFVEKTCTRYLLPDVPDDLITALSVHFWDDHSPPRARLYTIREYYDGVLHESSWSSDALNQDQYIQVSKK